MALSVKERLAREIDGMTDLELESVLRTVASIKRDRSSPMSGAAFAQRVAGLIPVDEMAAMESAIEEDSEGIDDDHAQAAA